MIDALIQLALFLIETLIIVIAILIILAGIAGLLTKGKELKTNKIKLKKLNDYYQEQQEEMQHMLLEKKAYKRFCKEQKKANKLPKTKRLFVLSFNGDIRGNQVDELRDEVSAILAVAKPTDEVVVKLESPGGIVPSYGLGASQLMRIKTRHIPLTVCVDKVAASGGYLMACVADKLIAAPFAILGSIGVLAQIPNFHRFLDDKKIDFEQITAGEYKRTVSVFGKNTSEGRKKLKEDLEGIHQQFKDFVQENRPQLDINQIATGEHWLAHKAFELRMVDALKTSDDYILEQLDKANVFEVKYCRKKRFGMKVTENVQLTVNKLLFSWWQRQHESQHLL